MRVNRNDAFVSDAVVHEFDGAFAVEVADKMATDGDQCQLVKSRALGQHLGRYVASLIGSSFCHL